MKAIVRTEPSPVTIKSLEKEDVLDWLPHAEVSDLPKNLYKNNSYWKNHMNYKGFGMHREKQKIWCTEWSQLSYEINFSSLEIVFKNDQFLNNKNMLYNEL